MNILNEKRRSAGHVFRCADAPDMTAANTAAAATAELSKEQLDWAKQIYAETAPDRAAANARAAEVSQAQLDQMRLAEKIAGETYDYQKNTFRPLEESLVAEAQAYDTPERRAAEMAKATAGVEAQLSAQRQATVQDNMRRGVNPSSMKMQALQGTMDIQASKAKAGAASAASDKVEQVGYARKMDAASLGRNLATDRVNATNTALTAGNSSVANAQVPTAVNGAGAGIVQGGYNAAIGGLSSAGSLFANTGAAGVTDNSATWGTLGSLAGAAIMAFSDEEMKEGIAPVSEEQALQAVKETPVSSWAYKAGTMGAEIEGTDKKVGPMAQDVQASMGDAVAPDGKKLDLVSMNGVLMAAVKGLAKKVDRITAESGLPAMA